MNERQWLESNDPAAMLGFVRDSGGADDRKLRLFAVACCRKLWPLMSDAQACGGIELAERFADGHDAELAGTTFSKLRRHYLRSKTETMEPVAVGCIAAAQSCLAPSAMDAAWSTCDVMATLAGWAALGGLRVSASEAADFWSDAAERARESEWEGQAELLRDIVGNPFRPVTADPRWLTANVLDLARVIYEERALDRLPILSDALQDAGCDHEAVLGHCREGPHVRGCWVLDLLLQKS